MDNKLKKLFTQDSYISMALGLVVVLGVGLLLYNFIKAQRQLNVDKTEKQNQQEKLEQSKSLPTTYTVAPGDTLWSISEKYIKSGYNWVDIQKANYLTNADIIEVGQRLTIPDVKPIQVGQVDSGVTTTAPSHPNTYITVPGDTLWSIAEKNYQTGYKWVDIAKANNLADPNLIFSGNVLTLP